MYECTASSVMFVLIIQMFLVCWDALLWKLFVVWSNGNNLNIVMSVENGIKWNKNIINKECSVYVMNNNCMFCSEYLGKEESDAVENMMVWYHPLGNANKKKNCMWIVWLCEVFVLHRCIVWSVIYSNVLIFKLIRLCGSSISMLVVFYVNQSLQLFVFVVLFVYAAILCFISW